MFKLTGALQSLPSARALCCTTQTVQADNHTNSAAGSPRDIEYSKVKVEISSRTAAQPTVARLSVSTR